MAYSLTLSNSADRTQLHFILEKQGLLTTWKDSNRYFPDGFQCVHKRNILG